MKPHDPCKLCLVKGACEYNKPRHILDRPKCFKYEIYKIKKEMYDRCRCWPKFHNISVDDNWLDSGKQFDEQLRLVDDYFVDMLFDEIFKNKPYRNIHLYREALSSILANLAVCRKQWLPLSKPQVKYHKNKYEWFKNVITTNILEDLVRAGYCLKVHYRFQEI